MEPAARDGGRRKGCQTLKRASAFVTLLLVAGTLADASAANRCVSSEKVALACDGIVAGGAGGALVWSSAGTVQVRHADGRWTPVIGIGAPDLRTAIADDAGFLVASKGPKVQALLLDREGTKRESWILDFPDGAKMGGERIDFTGDISLLSRSGRRWAVTNRALVPLLPGGKLGTPEPFPVPFISLIARASFQLVPSADVLVHEGERVLLCTGADILAEGYGEGLCELTGARGWRVGNAYDGPGRTVLCGDWLVHVAENRIGVRAVGTGRLVKEKRIAAGLPQVSCAGPDRVAVGESKTLELMALPSLKTVVRRSVTRALSTHVEVLGESVAYCSDKGQEISFLSLPCALPQVAGAVFDTR